jgi:predicted regulator of Ras-like GTPase activity (Roadblock/LC7/MglB family)/DNA-binding SARP family transcriptional activator
MAHSLMGSIYMKKGDFQAAIEEYQKILTLNPDDEETQTSLKQAIERAAGEQKKSQPASREKEVSPTKNQPKESTASLTIAELYSKQGHFDKAIEVYQELLAHDPQNLMLRQKLSEVVDRQQKEAGSDAAASRLKKTDFTQPPDQKEDVIVDDGRLAKSQGKTKKEDDSKFTSEDILQVMRKGGKDDVVTEEKAPPAAAKKVPSTPGSPVPSTEKKEPETKLKSEQVDGLKGILAELGGVSGILRCFVISREGNNVVSVGETGNNADLGKQVSAIFESTRRSVSQMNQGKLQQVLVTAETGHILLVSFANFVLIVLGDSKINLGLLRLALDSALKKLDKIL